MARATQQAADMLDQAGEHHAVEQIGKVREVNLPLSFRASRLQEGTCPALCHQSAQHTEQVRKSPEGCQPVHRLASPWSLLDAPPSEAAAVEIKSSLGAGD